MKVLTREEWKAALRRLPADSTGGLPYDYIIDDYDDENEMEQFYLQVPLRTVLLIMHEVYHDTHETASGLNVREEILAANQFVEGLRDTLFNSAYSLVVEHYESDNMDEDVVDLYDDVFHYSNSKISADIVKGILAAGRGYKDYAFKMYDELENVGDNQGYVIRFRINRNTDLRYNGSPVASVQGWRDIVPYLSNEEGKITKVMTGPRWVIDSSTNRFVSLRDVEADRNYTKCKICETFNRVRTHMIPVRSIKTRSGLRWRNRKNVCQKCVILIMQSESRATHYAEIPAKFRGQVAFDGEKNMMIAPVNTFHDNYREAYHVEDMHNLSNEYGRFFRKFPTLFNQDWLENKLYTLPVIEEGEHDYRFNTDMLAWNYQFPIFLTMVSGPEGYILDLQTQRYESLSIGYDIQTADWYRNNGPFYGVELECNTKQNRPDYRDVDVVQQNAIRLFHPDKYPEQYVQDGDHQLLYRKRDGSLNHHYGVEYVSQPLSYKYWRDEVPERFWKYFKDNFLARNLGECGIHVHIGWDSMTVPQRYVFLTILEEMQSQHSKVLRAITGRDSNTYARWNSLVYRGAKDRAFQVALEKTQTGENPKYNAINTRHEDTIELRYFQGNTGKNSILSIVQFIQKLYEFSYFIVSNLDWDYENDSPPEKLQKWIEDIKTNVDRVVIGYILDFDDNEYVIKRMGNHGLMNIVQNSFDVRTTAFERYSAIARDLTDVSTESEDEDLETV